MKISVGILKKQSFWLLGLALLFFSDSSNAMEPPLQLFVGGVILETTITNETELQTIISDQEWRQIVEDQLIEVIGRDVPACMVTPPLFLQGQNFDIEDIVDNDGYISVNARLKIFLSIHEDSKNYMFLINISVEGDDFTYFPILSHFEALNEEAIRTDVEQLTRLLFQPRRFGAETILPRLCLRYNLRGRAP